MAIPPSTVDVTPESSTVALAGVGIRAYGPNVTPSTDIIDSWLNVAVDGDTPTDEAISTLGCVKLTAETAVRDPPMIATLFCTNVATDTLNSTPDALMLFVWVIVEVPNRMRSPTDEMDDV